MRDWLKRWRTARTLERRAIPDALWRLTLARFPFLAARADEDIAALRAMSTLFLADKEFAGAHGLEVDDEMAVAIAAQACLPVLKLGLEWYDGFVGIVVHADAVVAQREMIDDDGVVHAYEEELAGEAMQGGPVMLSWFDVDDAAASAEVGYNVVIHEFVHVMDMRDGQADGVPTLPNRAAHDEWVRVLGNERSLVLVAETAEVKFGPRKATAVKEVLDGRGGAKIQHTDGGTYHIFSFTCKA